MLLCGRYISRAAGSITKSDYKDMICAGGQWLVEAIWNQAHPAENAGMSGSWPDAWGSTGAINDPDPAYRKYNAVKTFYEEHQYLAWYGNEESGQQTLEAVSYTHLDVYKRQTINLSNKQELVSICILYRQFILSYNVYRRFLLLGDFHLRKGVV